MKPASPRPTDDRLDALRAWWTARPEHEDGPVAAQMVACRAREDVAELLDEIARLHVDLAMAHSDAEIARRGAEKAVALARAYQDRLGARGAGR